MMMMMMMMMMMIVLRTQRSVIKVKIYQEERVLVVVEDETQTPSFRQYSVVLSSDRPALSPAVDTASHF